MKTKTKTVHTKIERSPDGSLEIVLAPGLVAWKPGQRVYFLARPGTVIVSPTLQRTTNGRVYSSRLRVRRAKVRPTFARESRGHRLSRNISAQRGRA